MKKVLLGLIKFLIFLIFTVSSVMLLVCINKLNILESKYFIIFSVIVSLLWLLIILKLIRKRVKLSSKLVSCIIAMIFSIIYLVGVKYIDKTIDFVSNMTNIDYETRTYSVMVLKSSNYDSIDELKNTNIGFLSVDSNLEKVKSKLQDKIKFKNSTYQDLGSLLSSIYDKKTSAVVLDKSYIDLIEENEISFTSESKIIYTFDLKTKKNENKIAVNINKEPFILYISGSDSRTTVSAVARSDVNIVAVINPNKNKILLVNVPRDYYVQLHGTTGTKDKLTHAGVYGIDMSKNTMQDLLDININYYAKVSFTTVIRVVDVIDGIDIYSDQAFTARGNRSCYITEGNQHLDGTCALAFARERYAYSSGDRHRGQNQQAVITAIINKLSNPKYLTKYDKILDAANGSFETNMSYDEITNLVKSQLTELKKWSIESISLDGSGSLLPTYSMGSQRLYVMIPDEQTVDDAKTKIKEYLSN